MQSALINAIQRTTLELIEKSGAFDAVVIGAGAAGGLAAERLTQAGLKVLLLDAGFQPTFLRAPFRRSLAMIISRLANPDFLPLLPPGLVRNALRAFRVAGRMRQRVQSSCYAWALKPDAFVDDWDCPYTTERPFNWIRARGLQGRVGDEFEAERAQVALVIPAVSVLGENALHPLAVEIEPMIVRSVDVRWKVGEAFGIDLPYLLLHLGVAVRKLERGEGALEVFAVRLADEAGLGDSRNEGGNRALAIGELGGTHQIVGRAQFVRKMMEHEDTAAQPIGPHFEARATARERILADGP